MNKLSKILLVIIILITIGFGIMTYQYLKMKEAYVVCAEEMVKVVEALKEVGSEIKEEKNGNIEIVDLED